MKDMEEKCYQRFDERGDEVLLRLAGQQNEIMLANGRYHTDYKTKFHLRTKDHDEKLKEIDGGFLKVAKEVSRDKKKKIGIQPNYITFMLMKMIT